MALILTAQAGYGLGRSADQVWASFDQSAKPQAPLSRQGDDTINGGAGAASMTGGAGDDTYVVDHAGDVVIELLAAGQTQSSRASATVRAYNSGENRTYVSLDVNGDGVADAIILLSGAHADFAGFNL